MAKVMTYLNFMGNTEEAFSFYKDIFGTDYSSPIQYMREVPMGPDMPELSEEEKGKVMNVGLPTIANHEIMGTDMLKSMGHELKVGNNVTICLQPDSLEETQRLYIALSEKGTEKVEPKEMYWGAWWGVCLDKYGVRWMFNYPVDKK